VLSRISTQNPPTPYDLATLFSTSSQVATYSFSATDALFEVECLRFKQRSGRAPAMLDITQHCSSRFLLQQGRNQLIFIFRGAK